MSEIHGDEPSSDASASASPAADVEAWLKTGEYLPEFMRDFHDQKDVFKAIQPAVERGNRDYLRNLSWVDAHVYTVDFFLWFMARRGYTLQRSRKRLGFGDMDTWVGEQKAERQRQMASVMGLTPLAAGQSLTSKSEDGSSPLIDEAQPHPPGGHSHEG